MFLLCYLTCTISCMHNLCYVITFDKVQLIHSKTPSYCMDYLTFSVVLCSFNVCIFDCHLSLLLLSFICICSTIVLIQPLGCHTLKNDSRTVMIMEEFVCLCRLDNCCAGHGRDHSLLIVLFLCVICQ